jgi:hypothetical protein
MVTLHGKVGGHATSGGVARAAMRSSGEKGWRALYEQLMSTLRTDRGAVAAASSATAAASSATAAASSATAAAAPYADTSDRETAMDGLQAPSWYAAATTAVQRGARVLAAPLLMHDAAPDHGVATADVPLIVTVIVLPVILQSRCGNTSDS